MILILLLCIILALFVIAALTRWWWIDFAKYADTAVINEAKQSAGGSKQGNLSKTLPFTEGDYRFNLLYNHIRVGQIEPRKMRRLQRKYLDFIAGMGYAHPDLIDPYVEPKKTSETDDKYEERRREALKTSHEELTKLQGNVSRAKHELAIRNLFWATTFTAVAAAVAAFAGAATNR
jgi:hypothetical protein